MKAKRWITFLIGVALLQGLFLLFCTESGLMLLYPYVVRATSEAYQPSSTTTVYYDMRLDVTDAPLFVVGMDFDVAESYDAFVHLFRFLKQYQNITKIYLFEYDEYADAIAARMEDPLLDHGLPPTLLDFADALAAINETQPPQKKFTLSAWPVDVYIDLPGDGSVLFLQDRDTMMEERSLESDELCIEMKYINCETNTGVRTDMDLPFSGEEIGYRFLSAKSIDWFYRYYEKVADPLGLGRDTTGLKRTSADYVIFVENGTATIK